MRLPALLVELEGFAAEVGRVPDTLDNSPGLASAVTGIIIEPVMIRLSSRRGVVHAVKFCLMERAIVERISPD